MTTASRWRGKRVGVLMGGWSHEREVSLRSGAAIAAALTQAGHTVVPIDVTPAIVDQLRAAAIHVAFVALHGTFGEDGTVQGLLETLRIPYTGSGVLASAVAMDKVVCKRVARELEIPVPEEAIFSATAESLAHFAERLPIDCPVIVKPAREGSTVGMTIVRSPDALGPALQVAAGSDHKILVEEYIVGAEVTVGLLAGRALPIIEIVPRSGFYDYAAKYTKGMTEYICPARIAESTRALLEEWSLRFWTALECRGFARADYIVRPDGTAVFLELNTIPGMTETSLIPKAAAKAGLDFQAVCETILEDAALKGS